MGARNATNTAATNTATARGAQGVVGLTAALANLDGATLTAIVVVVQ